MTLRRPETQRPPRDDARAGAGAPEASEAASLLTVVLERLRQRMSLFSFRGFIEPLRPRALRHLEDGGAELVLLAPSAFARDWARDHYGAELAAVACEAAGAVVRVLVEHDAAVYDRPAGAGASPSLRAVAPPEDSVAGEEPARSPAPVVRFEPRPPQGKARGKELSRPSRLSPKYTFDAFVSGPSNRMAHTACMSVAEHPGARYSPLFLFGGTGLGKTHLLHAIGNEALARHPQLRVAYVTAEQWVNEYITDVHERRFEDFRRRYRDGVDLLLVDDIQFLANKTASQDEFFHTFNSLYQAHKQIVVTSDRYPHEIAGLEERLKTRLQWGLVADVQPPEIQTRIAILQDKAHTLGCALPLDVAEHLATSVTTSIRELEGALVRLSAFSSLTREPITLEHAKEQLRPMLATRAAEITIPRVIDVVAAYYGLRPRDLVGPSRQRQITRARQVAMYLVRQHLARSLPEIGRSFGDRDHTTVLASVNKINGLRGTDAGVQAVLVRLQGSLFNVT